MAPDNAESGSSTPSASETRTHFSRFAANPPRVKQMPHNFTAVDAPSSQAANDGDFRATDNYVARRQRPNSGTQDGDDNAEAGANFEPALISRRSTSKHASRTKTRRGKYARAGRYALTDSSSGSDSEDESSDAAARSQQADRPGPSGVAARTDANQRQRVENPFVETNQQRPNKAHPVTPATNGEPTAAINTGIIGFGSSAQPRSGQSPAITSNETRETRTFNGAPTTHASTAVPDSGGSGFGLSAVSRSSRPQGVTTTDVIRTAATSQPAAQLPSPDRVTDAEVERVMGQVGHGDRFLRQSVQRSQQGQATGTAAQPPRTASAASGRSSTSIFNRSGNNILKRLSFVESSSRPPAQQSAATSQRRPSSPRAANAIAAASNETAEEDDEEDETGLENVPANYRPTSSMSSRPPSAMGRPRFLPTFGEPLEHESVTRTARACAAPSTPADDGEDSDETGFENVPPFKPKSGIRPQATSSTATSGGGRYGKVSGRVNDGARLTPSDSNAQEAASRQRPHSVTIVSASVPKPAEAFPCRSASQMQARLPTASVGNEKLEEYRQIVRGILRLRHPDMMMVRDLEGLLRDVEVSRTDIQVRLGVPLREFLVTVPGIDLLTMGAHDYCVYRPPDNAS